MVVDRKKRSHQSGDEGVVTPAPSPVRPTLDETSSIGGDYHLSKTEMVERKSGFRRSGYLRSRRRPINSKDVT